MDPYLLDFRKSTGDPLIGDNIVKANILTAKFFLKTGIVDLSNMAIEAIRD